MSKLKGDPGYRDGWCIHYLGPQDRGESNNCEAGIDLDSFTVPFHQRPCFLTKGKSKPDAAPCPHLRIPTADEIAAHDQWSIGRRDILITVMVGIAPWREKHQGENFAEIVECPACKGRLHLSIAGRKSHVHGRCETPNCVKWME